VTNWFTITQPDRKKLPAHADFSNCSPEKLSPMEAATKAAVKLGRGQLTNICFSGGVDSQALLIAFREAGVPYRIVNFAYGRPSEDNLTAAKVAVELEERMTILPIQAREFITSPRLQELARRYDTISPQLLTYIHAVGSIDGPAVMAGNFLTPSSNAINWTQAGLLRFAELDRPDYTPFFFLSTPELAYSFMGGDFLTTHFDPSRDDIDARIRFSSYAEKLVALKRAGFSIIPQSTKLTGFEELKASFDGVKVNSVIKRRWSSAPSARPFDLLYRYENYKHLEQGFYLDSTTYSLKVDSSKGT
jgi:hypothetical protein